MHNSDPSYAPTGTHQKLHPNVKIYKTQAVRLLPNFRNGSVAIHKMIHYLHLQLLITNQKTQETSINPILAYLLGPVAFLLISAYIFQKTEFAKYIMLLTCLSLLSKLSESNRTDFLIATFGDRLKNKIRILENGLVSLPFVTVLIYIKRIAGSRVMMGNHHHFSFLFF